MKNIKKSSTMSSSMKSTFQRVMFTGLALMTAVPAAALSGGGIAGVTIASAAAAGVLVYAGVKHRNKRNREDGEQCSNMNKRQKFEKHEKSHEGKALQSQYFHKEKVNPSQTKRGMKRDLKFYKRDIEKHSNSLESLRRKGKGMTESATQHKTKINELRNIVDELETKIDNFADDVKSRV
jgi:uncharacterized protein HemX